MAQFINSANQAQLLGLPVSSSSGIRLPTANAMTVSSPNSSKLASCCEGNKPVVPDPLTGQLICSCKLESRHQAAASFFALPRFSGYLGGLNGLYGSLAGPPTSAAESSFFPSGVPNDFFGASGMGSHLDLKDTLCGLNPAALPGWPYASYYGACDPAIAASYQLGGYGFDLNSARRKNATRETTSTLKAWLSEHKKNPYPTKGEKIMLAIITKMTLTQVSTWFANARRRLKKENKMTWEPKNRNEDDDGDDDSEAEGKQTPGDEKRETPADRINPETSTSGSGNTAHHSGQEDSSDHDSDSCPSPRLGRVPDEKPRIWSLADMASTRDRFSVHPSLQYQPFAMLRPDSLVGGKMPSALASRLSAKVEPYQRPFAKKED